MVSVVIGELKDRGLTEDQIKSSGYRIVSTFDPKLMKTAQRGRQERHVRRAEQPRGARQPGGGRPDQRPGDRLLRRRRLRQGQLERALRLRQAGRLGVQALRAGRLAGGRLQPEQLAARQRDRAEGDPRSGAGAVSPTTTAARRRSPRSPRPRPRSTPPTCRWRTSSTRTPGRSASSVRSARSCSTPASPRTGSTPTSSVARYQFSIGSAPVTAVEQAAGYSIFANAGKHVNYHVVKGVYLGKELKYPERKPVKQVISPEASADAVVALEEVLKSVRPVARASAARPAARPAPTTRRRRPGSWGSPRRSPPPSACTARSAGPRAARSSPRSTRAALVEGQVAGEERPQVHDATTRTASPMRMSLGFAGASFPTRIWREFMLEAHKNKEVVQFPPKAGISFLGGHRAQPDSDAQAVGGGHRGAVPPWEEDGQRRRERVLPRRPNVRSTSPSRAVGRTPSLPVQLIVPPPRRRSNGRIRRPQGAVPKAAS